MSPLLQQVLQEIEQLTPAEQLEVISHTTEQLKHQTIPQYKPKRRWLDIAGTAPYPLVGEDAQEWVTRTRQESQEHRDRLLGRESES
jgi:hypothetical protein